MSDCMTQEDAMNMNNEQAVSILIPLRDMMRDQHGCPISDAYFALDKAIEALKQSTHPNTSNTLSALDTIYRQAAIEEAKKLFEMGDCYCDRASIVGMLNSMPSVQPTQNSRVNSNNALDTINRQAAIDAFDGTKVDEEDCTEYDIGYNDGIDFAVSKLSALPSAQPEPERKTGEWKNTRPDAPMFGFYFCSVCGRKRTSPQDCYCPNCGAKMEE